jgi:hypothetical protein
MLVGKLENNSQQSFGNGYRQLTQDSTNTDGVIIDPSRSHEDDRGIVAW